ncbi:hypothetical protein [Kineothrix sp. MB12-C1]|uniref:hypothetical protein n=1 Tax=Kineothrix sp. MB12-C1 TaxID=3070215 RepID=UPI0027D2907F|nr:hypothetical protein [Kineothrix sp. MB12-C1]WMC91230.1 hypothetical protein RBB56_10070 [Kineothrix sp. MB12-C1]
MQDGNYIKINRSILDWEWYKNINTKVLFLHMLLKANWKDGKFEGKVIPRGSFVSSIRSLSDETMLTEREIRTAISHLKTTGEVTSKGHNKYSVFTVVNYNSYQANDTQNVNQETGNRHSNDKLTTTIEEGKKERREEYISPKPPLSPLVRFEEFYTCYPLDDNKCATERAYVDVMRTGNYTEDDLITAAKNYAEYCKILNRQDQFIKTPSRWLSEAVFEKYLPEKYKKPNPPAKKENEFNKFQQHDYDFDSLEKELLKIR